MDTAKISIWDVFGVPRPSETQQMRAVQLEQEAAELDEPEIEMAPTPVVVEEPLLPSTEETEALIFPVSAEPPPLPDIDAVEPPAVEVVQAEPVVIPTVQPIVVAEPAVEQPASTPKRAGLRIVQRRKLVKIRRVD